MAGREKIVPATATEPTPGTQAIQRSCMKDCDLPDLYARPATLPTRVAEPDNLVLQHLKKIQVALSAARERDREIISRLGNVEMSVATLRREFGHCEESIAAMNVRIDRVSDRIERIERRLELAG